VGGSIGEEPGHPDDVDRGGGGSSSDDEDDGDEDGDVKRWRILYAALDKVRARQKRPPAGRRDNLTVVVPCRLSCCAQDGVVYRCGDAVFLKNPSDDELPYIAQITKMWADRATGQMLLRTKWFYRPDDLRCTPVPPAGKHEIFFSNAEDTNQVESLCGRITVLSQEGASASGWQQQTR